jgi:hypothetical protein
VMNLGGGAVPFLYQAANLAAGLFPGANVTQVAAKPPCCSLHDPSSLSM